MNSGLIYFYTDGSSDSEKVREALDKRGVTYVSLPQADAGEKAPAVVSNKYVLEGIEEICQYLLPELDES